MTQRREATTPVENGNALVPFLTEHVGLLVPLVGVLIFFIRCIAVSRGNPYTAFVLVSQTSIGDAIRATMFPAVPLILATASLVGMFAVFRSGLGGGGVRLATLLLLLVSGVSLLVALFFMGVGLAGSAVVALGLMVMMTILYLGAYLQDRRFAAEMRRYGYRRGGADRPVTLAPMLAPLFWWARLLLVAALGGALIWWLLASQVFWLPPERLVFRNEAPITGYLLKVSEQHLVVLEDRRRVVIEKPEAALVDRKFCSFSEISDAFLRQNFPMCPR